MSFLPMLYDKGSCYRGPLQSTHPHREDSLSKSWQIPTRLMPRTCFEFQSHPSCCHYSSHTNHRSFPRFNESTSISPASYNSHLPFWLLTVSCALGVNVIYKYSLVHSLCMDFSSDLYKLSSFRDQIQTCSCINYKHLAKKFPECSTEIP